MVRRLNGRLPWLALCAAVLSLALGSPAFAQSTGMIRGVVKDAAGKPVEGAKVNIDSEANNRHFDTKSDKKGEFLQIGLAPGPYKVTAEKDKVASAPTPITVRIASASPITLVLGGGGAGGASPEAAAKSAALKKTFEEGVAASRAGNHDAAIASFQAAAELNPNCFDCYYNIAYSESQKKDWDKAEVAYKKAIELKADYAEAYSGLANVYNASRKFDQAAAASAKAMELSGSAPGALAGGNADAMFNQGVILWNAGKIPEAKKQFEGAVAANPNHAESHYQLGMALVNEGNLAAAATEFETYLKLAPTGPNAATAKGILGSLKK
ncbi:MAG TPA: tetratricopeptide repeat protein [Vicinamibacterales bacterium]|jgi:tetratricopeptide (TPR) repeat protein|nr:tetratricopeptide repeat protein [Vicinamibacterales bacterium]